jgi:hypothetical protein
MAGNVTGLSDFIAVSVTFKMKVTLFLGAHHKERYKDSELTRKTDRRSV